MIGYGYPASPSLGFQWLKTATRRLLHPKGPSFAATKKGDDLPTPRRPPNDTSADQDLFMYFTHREEVPTVMTALHLFRDDPTTTTTWPVDRVNPDRKWKTSRIIPFLGHVALERLHCEPKEHHHKRDADDDGEAGDGEVDMQKKHKKGKKSKKEKKGKKHHHDGDHEDHGHEDDGHEEGKNDYVRVLVNEAHFDLPECHDGLHNMCRLASFKKLIQEKEKVLGDFEAACDGLKDKKLGY